LNFWKVSAKHNHLLESNLITSAQTHTDSREQQ
jgi:hypothetical protein